jgi:hypothetical protein
MAGQVTQVQSQSNASCFENGNANIKTNIAINSHLAGPFVVRFTIGKQVALGEASLAE